ncbi:MAG: ACT domain-containing protein [Acidobacteriota bacterium]|nr:ACT domain-containing protein [Acidobacteriota bacterium]
MIFTHLRDTFAIVRLPSPEEIPRWASGEFVSITRTADELSIVCRESAVPAGNQADRGWECLKVEGPMPLTTVGVAADFTALLAKAGVSVFLISTFDTDYVLVKGDALGRAEDALRGGGHSVRRPL